MKTLRDLIESLPKPIESVKIYNPYFDYYATYKPWDTIPAHLMDSDFIDAFHDVFGMDGKKNILYVRMYV